MVFISSPQGARDVLGRRDAFVDRGTLSWMTELRRVVGGNLLNLVHDEWLPRRRALQPIFSKQNVTQFTGHIVDAAEHISRRWAEKGDVDLGEEMHELTLGALSRSFLGVDLGAQADSVGSAMRQGFTWTADRAFSPVRAPMWLPTPAQRRAYRGSALLHRYAADVVRACRANPDHDAPVVRALMAACDPETEKTLSDTGICDELSMFMFGGHETISTMLTYALWALGRHPELQQRVADEANAIGERPLTADDLPRLNYTEQVLHEALRLCPPVPSLLRMVRQDVAVDGYRVKAGTIAVVGVYSMQRDPRLWDEPFTFDPDRFGPERSKGRDRWQFLPFGAGPHSCMGDHFATLEATLALAAIMRDIVITSARADFPIAAPFTLVAAGPVLAKASWRHATAVGARTNNDSR
jgi:cytochrome P450